MDSIIVAPFIEFLQSTSSEVVSLLLFIICSISILFLFRILGLQGLYLYNVVAILVSNIQVLRSATFVFSQEPIALGTIVFASTFISTDIITEHYGKESAKTGIWLCFIAQILLTILMLVGLGYPKLQETLVINTLSENSNAIDAMMKAEEALSVIFTPSLRILFASLFAFVVSQWLEIWIFDWIRKHTGVKRLWLRTFISGSHSAIIDTVLFSVLAWVVLAPNPVSFHSLLFTYILGTLLARIILGSLGTPLLYLSYYCKPLKLRYAT